MRITEEELLKPITRTLHDHAAGITCLAFHPTNPTLFSGSKDKAVKIFDLTRPPGHKKAFSVLQDVHPVRCLHIHPCGDFLYVGTSHQALRLYDLQTLNCFTTYHQGDHHAAGINDVRCTSDGRIVASASADGSIQIWDAVTLRVANCIPKAHSGTAVTSLRWSRNLRYLLSSGADGRHRLWDIRTGQELFSMGFGPRAAEFSTAVFTAGEKYIAGANSNVRISDASLFDAKTGSPIFTKLGMHAMPVHALDASPVDKTLITGCDDEKARYFSVNDV
jgi:cleavage stimulation factor subunit 1